MNYERAQKIIDEDLAAIMQEPLDWHCFEGATVLISGANGFLPAYMVETLLHLNQHCLRRPARVVALVRNAQRARERFARYDGRKDLEFLVQDVTAPVKTKCDFDYIVHAASQASPIYYKTDPVGTLMANVEGTANLLRLANREDCRGFLFFSSGDVYGHLPPEAGWITESMVGTMDPTCLRSCYGEGKRVAETMCVCWAQQYGIPTRMIRLGHTYGPGIRLDDGRVFCDFVRDIVGGGPIILHSDGSARRSFCYISDATRAFFTVLLKGGTAEAYNIVNPAQDVSILELAQRLAYHFRARGITVEQRVETNQNYLPATIAGVRASIDKIATLGWQPRISIEEGFARTVACY